MFQDWQTVAVFLIILAALAYVGRRGLARARSFRAGGRGQAISSASSCASGCGGCGDGEQSSAATKAAATALTRPQNVLVQITNAGGATRRRK